MAGLRRMAAVLLGAALMACTAGVDAEELELPEPDEVPEAGATPRVPDQHVGPRPGCDGMRPLHSGKPARITTLGVHATLYGMTISRGEALLLDAYRLWGIGLADGKSREIMRVPGISPGIVVATRRRIYWTETGRFQDPSGAIRYRDRSTGAVTTLIEGQQSPQSLVVRKGEIRWMDWDDGGVYRLGDGGKRVEIANGGRGMSHYHFNTDRLVDDGRFLYFVRRPKPDDAAGEIVRMGWDGSNPRVIARLSDAPDSLTTDETHVYWVSSHVARVAKGGGEIQRLGKSVYGMTVHLHDDYVYWLEAPPLSAGTTQILRVRTTGGPTEIVIESERQGGRMAIVGDSVVWSHSGHLEGECRTEHRHYYKPGNIHQRKRVNMSHEVCDGPDGELLRIPIPRGC